MKTIHTIMAALAAVLLLSGCNEFLDITPTGKVIAKTGEEYRDLLTYEYKYFAKDRYMTTLRTDEVVLDRVKTSSTDLDAYLDLWRWKDEDPAPTTSYFSWRSYYHAIYIANYIIEHQKEISNASADEVEQLVGEAWMMRAYCHFLLVNLYAEPYTHCVPATTRGVPLMLKADVNAVPASSSVERVYAQVLADIDEAAAHLQVEQWEEGLNYRFNRLSAEALRARVLLYMGNWTEALEAAAKVVEAHPALEDMTTSATLPNDYRSVESIVALEKLSANLYTVVDMPSPEFIGLYRSGDQRRTKYFKRVTSSAYSLQKGADDAYACSFRSAEAYLTAAECAARLGQKDEAVSLYLEPLMKARLSASAYETTAALLAEMSAEELVGEVMDERARELAFEGHRWFDLRRTTQPELTRSYDGETFTLSPEKYTLRFPAEAVEANPNINRLAE